MVGAPAVRRRLTWIVADRGRIMGGMSASPRRDTLGDMLTRARRRIRRLQPQEAQDAVARGALIIDIRASGDRERDGVIPGSLHIPRTVLEWRLAAHGDALTTLHSSPARLAAFHETFTLLAALCALAMVAAWQLRAPPASSASASSS